MISLDRLEIPNLGFSRIFVIARIRYKNRCELINILFNLHQSVHPLLGPYSAMSDRLMVGRRGGSFKKLELPCKDPVRDTMN